MGKIKRGKGTKIMAVADRAGLPLAISVCSASPHEVTLVDVTLDALSVPALPQRLIGDRAYDSDSLDSRLSARGIEMIAPHRRNRRKRPTQDGRPLRRYKRRWKIDRLFAWLQTIGVSWFDMNVIWRTTSVSCSLGASSFYSGTVFEIASNKRGSHCRFPAGAMPIPPPMGVVPILGYQ